jgi:hypothetical protein
MFGRFFNGVKTIAGKAWDVMKPTLRTIGSFAVKNHQPISMLINQATQTSDNPYVRMIGTGAIAGSALATRAGIGNNYLQPPPQ